MHFKISSWITQPSIIYQWSMRKVLSENQDTKQQRSRKCSLNTYHRWPEPKLQRHDNKWTSLQPEYRQWQSPLAQTSSAGTPVREEWGIWGGLLQQCLSNNGMTWAWLISKPGQKPFSTSKFTDSCRSNLLSICAHGTGWVNKDSCIKFECTHTHTHTHTPAWVWAHICVRASDCVCGSETK